MFEIHRPNQNSDERIVLHGGERKRHIIQLTDVPSSGTLLFGLFWIYMCSHINRDRFLFVVFAEKNHHICFNNVFKLVNNILGNESSDDFSIFGNNRSVLRWQCATLNCRQCWLCRSGNTIAHRVTPLFSLIPQGRNICVIFMWMYEKKNRTKINSKRTRINLNIFCASEIIGFRLW